MSYDGWVVPGAWFALEPVGRLRRVRTTHVYAMLLTATRRSGALTDNSSPIASQGANRGENGSSAGEGSLGPNTILDGGDRRDRQYSASSRSTMAAAAAQS